MQLFPFLLILFSASLSFLLLIAIIPFLKKSFVDIPNLRSSHMLPTPRGGGISFILIATLSSIIFICFDLTQSTFVILPLIVLPLSLVGLLDDRFQLSSLVRYFFQLLTAISLLLVSPLFLSLFSNDSQSLFSLVLSIFLILFVSAIINFVNFMDGIDGLVSSSLIVALGFIAFFLNYPLSVCILLGSLIGFLFCNWSPARVFMGDSGSTFLGAIYAGILLQASSWNEAICFLLLITPLILDSCFCVIRRFFSGQQIFEAHRLHIYQRLTQAGWSHSSVSLLYALSCAFIGISLLFDSKLFSIFSVSSVIILGIYFDRHVAIPFSLASAEK